MRVKPKVALLESDGLSREQRDQLARSVRYQGSPFHKRYPADYGFPEVKPRPDKTLCDADRALSLPEAQALLAEGVRRGMISVQFRNGWPQNIWAVKEGIVYESQLQNQVLGEYHGYPMNLDVAFARVVQEERYLSSLLEHGITRLLTADPA
jgi:hypothetical protein